MQKEQKNEVNATDSLLYPSFSVYSSNNINDVAQQVINENDNDDFEFVAFQKTENDNSAENFILLRQLVKRDGYRRNSDAVDISIPLQKLIIGDQKRNVDPLSSCSSEVENDIDDVPPASYCLWTPRSPRVSPIASPINSKKSKSTGSTSNPSSSKRWKFLSLLRRSKSDGKESLILVTPSLEFKKEAKVENSKVKSSGKESAEKNIAKVVEKNISATERKIPVQVTAMEAFYLRKKEIKRKSYLPYKQELIGFHATVGRAFPLRV